MADFVLHIQKLSKLRFPLDYKFDSADKKLQGIKKVMKCFCTDQTEFKMICFGDTV